MRLAVWYVGTAGWFELRPDGAVKIDIDDPRVIAAKKAGRKFFLGDDAPMGSQSAEVDRLTATLSTTRQERDQATTMFEKANAKSMELIAQIDAAHVGQAAAEDRLKLCNEKFEQLKNAVSQERETAKGELNSLKALAVSKDARIADLERDLAAARVAPSPPPPAAPLIPTNGEILMSNLKVAALTILAVVVIPLLVIGGTVTHRYFWPGTSADIAVVQTELNLVRSQAVQAAKERDEANSTATSAKGEAVEAQKAAKTAADERDAAKATATSAMEEADKAKQAEQKAKSDLATVRTSTHPTPSFRLADWDGYDGSERLGLLIEQCNKQEDGFFGPEKQVMAKLAPLTRMDASRIMATCDPAEIDKKPDMANGADKAPATLAPPASANLCEKYGGVMSGGVCKPATRAAPAKIAIGTPVNPLCEKYGNVWREGVCRPR